MDGRARTSIDGAGRAGGRILVIGEVLFDRFPDGERLGGAPFNVAWHLTGLGLDPLFVSRVGADPQGARVRAAMTGHGMDTAGLQQDENRPTGAVDITLDGHGGHDFTILPDQAYDHLDAAALHDALGGAPSMACFGTLALRSPASRGAILDTVTQCRGPRLLDVNLRKDCWSTGSVATALETATVAKLNDEELDTLGGLFGLSGGEAERVAALRERFALDAVCVTRGEFGALWLDGEGVLEAPVPERANVVDTVGAGDAFSSVLLCGLAHGWPAAVTLPRAAELAARVCGMRGACPEDAAFYRELRDAWGKGIPA